MNCAFVPLISSLCCGLLCDGVPSWYVPVVSERRKVLPCETLFCNDGGVLAVFCQEQVSADNWDVPASLCLDKLNVIVSGRC